MRKIVEQFVRFPFYANIIIAVVLIAGFGAMIAMKKSFFPERQSREIYVTVVYPGASPKEMEEGITTRIEEAVRGIVGIKEFTSTSSENFSRVAIETTGEYDLDETLQEVKNAVDGISSFPVDAEKPVVFKRRTSTNAMRIGLSGDVDLLTLKKHADQIEEDFLRSGIVTQMSISGYPSLEISVEIKEENRLRYNLTFDEISRAIALNNRDISAGMIKSQEEEILIRSRARSVNPDKIGEIILRANNDGSYLRIRDIAKVTMQFADVTNKSLMNGKQSVFISVQKLITEDLQDISEYCHNYADEFNKNHKDIKMEITYDFMSILNSRLRILYSNGGIGLILVIITLALFLNMRLSSWVALGIPFSFMAMFVVANLYGVTINMISLFGMILVIGILVDDGIVIAENIFQHFEKRKSPMRAAIDGTMEVMPAVFTSVTTTIIAFLPLFLLQGRMEFLFEMAFVVIFSLLFSLVEAFFVLPAHLGTPHILRSKERANKTRLILDKLIRFMRERIYGRLLKIIIQWRWIFAALPLAMLLMTIGMFRGGVLKATFFPTIPFDAFNVEIAFKPGDGEKRTFDYLKKYENIIWEVDKELKAEYNDTASFIKYTFLNLGSAFDGQDVGAHAGTIFVLLRDMEGAPVSSFEIAERVRNKIGEVPEAEKFKVGGRNRWGSPVAISLLGKNLEELDSAKLFLRRELENIDQLKNITDNNAEGKREVRIQLKPKAYFLGLNHASISNQVRTGFFGGQAQRLQQGKDEIRVWVRYPKQDRQSIGQLDNMKIKTPNGEYFLSELVDYTIERGPVNIKRFNASREIRIEADLEDPYAPVPPILARVQNEVIPLMKSRYPGVDVFYQGQQRDSAEAMGDMQKYFGIAFAIIVIILMIHFKSTWNALIIIMMIPMGWLGSVWGHGVEGLPVSMLSAWGMVALSGVIINDAVVFFAKYETNLLEGMPIQKAVYEAGKSRFRPILLTTITTTVGLYPIILEGSFQAQFLKPMAASLAYGVFVGTAFILLFFPALILVLNDFRVYFTWLWTGKRPKNEEVETVIKGSKRIVK